MNPQCYGCTRGAKDGIRLSICPHCGELSCRSCQDDYECCFAQDMAKARPFGEEADIEDGQ